MKKLLLISILFSFINCTNTEGEDHTTFSTIDSNTVESTDTLPHILYLDNTKLDSFPMAMDSAGPTIEAADTQYKKATSYTFTE